MTCRTVGCPRPPLAAGWCWPCLAARYNTWKQQRRRVAAGMCTAEGCGRPVESRGMCVAHYHRWYRQHADPDTCTIDGCTRPRKARGWCNMHYMRWQRHGSVGEPQPRIRGLDICRVPDCDRPHYVRGLCKPCYMRTLRGDTERAAWLLDPLPVGKGA